MREIQFRYRNYAGVEGPRIARPISLRYGTSEWHREPQWLMLAYDVHKEENREFALKDMKEVQGPLVFDRLGQTLGDFISNKGEA
jgi:predicted DNA-binding transcriptional regulator YafY